MPAGPIPDPPEIPEGIEHLLPMFVAEMEKDAARLHELADASDEDLGEYAHGARGKAAMFGEHSLYALFSRIEEMALTGADRAELPSLLAQVVERLPQLRIYLAASTAEPT